MKLIVCISNDDNTRAELIERTVVKLGFAIIPSDARKIIKQTPYDFSQDSFFVFAKNYNLNSSPSMTRQLIERALRGQAVVVGAKRIPSTYEPFCEVIYK